MQIAILNTGGTISCVGDPLAPMSAAAFAATCSDVLNPIISTAFPNATLNYVTDFSFPESSNGALDSTNLQPSDWCLMAAYILEHYYKYDGWVILHGTDSLDYTGAAMSFLMSTFDAKGVGSALLSKPIIITGSQVPMFYQAGGGAITLNFNTDAYQNFCGAIAAAQTGISEVCVYFESHLYRGSRVVKTNANQFNAFSSPNYPALGQYGIKLSLQASAMLPPPVSPSVSLDTPSVLHAAQARITAIAAAINSVPVMQFSAFPAPYNSNAGTAVLANLITACAGQGVAGLVLQSYGEGNFPSGNPDTPSSGAIYKALEAANAAGIVIVDNTQVLTATVNDNAYAAGAWLPAIGALNPADMTPIASAAKLTVLLASAAYQGFGNVDIRFLMSVSLLGEKAETTRLDSRRQAVLLAGETIAASDGSAVLTNDPIMGPIVSNSEGQILWAPLPDPSPAQMPGRLVMQDDGNLVFYGRDNSAMWATNTGVPGGASSILGLFGSDVNSTLSVVVYDYVAGQITATLYTQPVAAQ